MVVLYVSTRNEAELLRLNLAHHLAWGFDHAAIADNESTDATQDVLRAFGDAVTTAKISKPNDRFAVLSGLVARIEARFGTVDWVAFSDTDEFWWAPDTELRDLLARFPSELVAVNSDQKFFLNTELDSPTGPVYCRRTFRTTDAQSPLHTSYRKGKTLYRGGWVREHGVVGPHWSRNIPHPFQRLKRALVHHYGVDGEDSFVKKVTGLERRHPLLRRPEPGMTAKVRDFKKLWWRVYETGGEAALRDYYREQYVISGSSLPGRVERREIVEDREFADFMRSGNDAG